jgi:hypothetical protein
LVLDTRETYGQSSYEKIMAQPCYFEIDQASPAMYTHLGIVETIRCPVDAWPGLLAAYTAYYVVVELFAICYAMHLKADLSRIVKMAWLAARARR